MQTKLITVIQYICERCGHKWQPRGEKLPLVCPNGKCKSRYWAIPRRKKVA